MLDFDPRPAGTTATRTKPVITEAPVVVEKVTSTPVGASTDKAYLMKPDASWEWDDLRDFVFDQIETRHGRQVRDFRKESGIFKSFLSRYGDRAVPIARLVFSPVFDGMWNNSPVTATRFCKGSDAYFGDVLAKRL